MLQSSAPTFPTKVATALGQLDTSIQGPHAEINELLNDTVLFGGKRLRPMLTLLMGSYFGLKSETVLPYAKVIEMVHSASLAHDDVVDQATTRRDRPSINVAASNKRAILGGDYLLAQVISDLTQLGNLSIVRETADVIRRLAEGEWLQMNAVQDRSYGDDTVEQIAEKKTASVMSWCTLVPALLASIDPKGQGLARAFGTHLGLAFQLVDDTLDESVDSKKDHLLDMRNGTLNAVHYAWLRSHPEMMEAYRKGLDLPMIFTGVDFRETVEEIHRRASSHLERAKACLDELSLTLGLSEDAEERVALCGLLELIRSRKY